MSVPQARPIPPLLKVFRRHNEPLHIALDFKFLLKFYQILFWIFLYMREEIGPSKSLKNSDGLSLKYNINNMTFGRWQMKEDRWVTTEAEGRKFSTEVLAYSDNLNAL